MARDDNYVGDSSQCAYCDEPRDQHPVHDDFGDLACSGMEAWW